MDDQGTNREGGGVRYRKLRIAWSVVWGVACLLLIALWVRSYWWLDFLYYQYSATHCLRVILHGGNVLLLTEASQGQALTYGSVRQSGFDSTVWYVVPIWFFSVLVSLAAIAPWLPWRFSLRTLLIAMTLAGLLLGAIVMAVK